MRIQIRVHRATRVRTSVDWFGLRRRFRLENSCRPRLVTNPAECESRAQPRTIVAKFEPGVVQSRNGRDEAQSKARSGRIAAGFQPDKTLRYPLTVLWRNAGTVVGNQEDALAIAVFEANVNRAARRSIFDRVVDQIRQGLRNQIAVAAYDTALGRYRHGKALVLFLRQRTIK